MRRRLVVLSAVLGIVGCGPASSEHGQALVDAASADSAVSDDAACAGDSCDPCHPANLGNSYIGCEYYPTVTANLLFYDNFRFAITVSNAGSDPANVTIDGGALELAITFVVAPGGVQIQELEWDDDLKKQKSGSILKSGAAYHVVSDQPVTVYQFSPLNYQRDDLFSFTNDASMLIPTNALTGNYWVASWPSWNEDNAALVAVTATADDTSVLLKSTTSVTGGSGPALPADTLTEVILQRGDVLQLLADGGDFSGTQVGADKPVQVIGGHRCTNIPHQSPACDHLEEVMFPAETLGRRYVVTAPMVTKSTTPKNRYLKILATAPDTALSYDPPQPEAPTLLAKAGDVAVIESTNQSMVITATHRVLIAEFMTGRTASPDDEGDPAMSLAVPADQYRRRYLFHAPHSYDSNMVNIVAPAGSMILLDGEPVTDFVAIGAGEFELKRQLLGDGESGNHTISGDRPFGISVYGYGEATSYWYPGGLELAQTPVE